jgi:hypothetical protein
MKLDSSQRKQYTNTQRERERGNADTWTEDRHSRPKKQGKKHTQEMYDVRLSEQEHVTKLWI